MAIAQVVAPLYKKMRAEMGRRAKGGKPLGHTRKCNYDDVNEFFWSAECLNYSYHASAPIRSPLLSPYAAPSAFDTAKFDASAVGPEMPPSRRGVGKMRMSKRYVERRSWLHPIRSFWRIHSFLLQAYARHASPHSPAPQTSPHHACSCAYAGPPRAARLRLLRAA